MTELAQSPAKGGILKHVVAAFFIAAVFYFAAYGGVEYLRQRKGGWQVTFAIDNAGAPRLLVEQPHLGISNVAFVFPEERLSASNQLTRLVFDRPITNVPFGKVVYLDTTFLPGAIVFDLFGHQVQLLPRVLMIDGREEPWRNGRTFTLQQTNAPPQRTVKSRRE